MEKRAERPVSVIQDLKPSLKCAGYTLSCYFRLRGLPSLDPLEALGVNPVSVHQSTFVRTGRIFLVPFFLGFALDAATSARGWSSPKSTYGEPERPSSLETVWHRIRPEPHVRVLLKDLLSLSVSRPSSRTVRDVHATSEMLRASVGSDLQGYSI